MEKDRLWHNIRQSILGGLQTSVETAGKYSRVGQLKLEISHLQKDVRRLMQQMGTRVYDLMSNNLGESISVDTRLREMRREADELTQEIARIEAQISQLQNPALPGSTDDDEHQFV